MSQKLILGVVARLLPIVTFIEMEELQCFIMLVLPLPAAVSCPRDMCHICRRRKADRPSRSVIVYVVCVSCLLTVCYSITE